MTWNPTRTIARTLMVVAALAIPFATTFAAPARAEVVVSVGFAPPALPVYAQPACPGDGYLWTPGYWAYGDDGYFWVPGTWIRPPRVGYLWTPGYWGWEGSGFVFHRGYWGERVGYYGGIHYGFGYTGIGYEGGYWRNGAFAYNRAVNNIDIGYVRNVYERPVAVHNEAFNHVSYNGGRGGVPYSASPEELAASRGQHLQPTSEQMQHRAFAAQNREQFARFNGGRPAVTAAPSPGAFRSDPATARGGLGGRPGNANQRERQQPASNSFRNSQTPAGETARAEQQPPNAEGGNRSAAPRTESRPAPPAHGGKPR